MPELNITRGYADGEALLEADLDNIRDAVTTLNNTTLYDGDNLQSALITTTKILDDSVTSATLGVGCVTTHKVNDLAITTAKFEALTIVARNIDSSAVTTAKLDNSSVTTAKFDTTARLSSNKIAARVVLTGSNASPTTDSTGYGEVTIVTATAVSAMKRCLIMLQPYDNSESYIGVLNDNRTDVGSIGVNIKFKINGETQATRSMNMYYSSGLFRYYRLPLSAFSMIMTPSSPSVISIGDTITATMSLTLGDAATGTATVTACKIVVVEL